MQTNSSRCSPARTPSTSRGSSGRSRRFSTAESTSPEIFDPHPPQRISGVVISDFLAPALNKAVHSLQDDFPVIRDSDMVGVISKQRILDALRAEGNGYVQAVMNKIFEVSLRKDSLGSAFRKLTARNSSIIPVVEDQRLIGIVTLQNLMHSMALLAESRKLRRDEAET